MKNLTHTGTQINYYFVCKRKLWLFSHGIQMEHTSGAVEIGKLIGEDSYSRNKKEIEIDGRIKIDLWEKEGVIHEIKKTDKIEDAHIWQLKYYLFYMKHKGVSLRGKIDYPKLKKCKDVDLTDDDCRYIEELLGRVDEVLQKDVPPEIINSKICRKCSYEELCYS